VDNARSDYRHDARDDGAPYQRVEVITGRQRRRTWADDEKQRIVLESLKPDANVSAVARRNGMSRGLLNIWRREAREASRLSGTSMFAAIRVENEGDSDCRDKTAPQGKASRRAASVIEIELCGATLRIPKGADRPTLEMVISALRGTR
jgi:transposase